MVPTKMFKVTKGIDQNATFMSPYLGLKLGLCNAVCLSAKQFQLEENYLNRQIAPIYQNLVSGFINTDLAEILEELPINLINHVISVRTEEDQKRLEKQLNDFVEELPFHPTNNVHLAIDILSGQNKAIATNFFTYIESTTEQMAEFYRYTCIGNTSYYALNLKDALQDVKEIYQRQCPQIKIASKTVNIDPHEITKFSILIEKIIVDTHNQVSAIDKSKSFTLTPTDLL